MKLQPTSGGQHCLVQLRWKERWVGDGVIHVSDPDWHLIQNMLNSVHVWTPSWPVHDLNILLVQQGCRVTCCMGRGIVLDIQKVTSKHPRRSWQHMFPQDLDVQMLVHGSIHHDRSPLHPLVDCTPYHTDRSRFPSLDWMQASINLSLRLRGTRTRPSLWYRENQDSSLKMQCLHCLRSHTLCFLPNSRRVASPVLQSAPRKSADHLHSQTRSRHEAVRSDHSEQLTVVPWRGDFHRTSTLPLMWSASLSVVS